MTGGTHMKWDKRQIWRIGVLLLLMVLAFVTLVRQRFPPDPLAKYRTTVKVPLPDEARQTAETALAHIAANEMDSLFGMMANQDGILFKGRYVTGIFAGGDFAPAKISCEVRKLEHSSIPHVMIRVHSEPRERDYWMTLLERDGKYLIGSISPAGDPL